jgi:glucosylceramidase
VWGNIIFNDLEAGTSAWLYWNAILDETGGPWAVSPVHGNPDPNIQHPVVIVNKTTHEVTYTGTYWYLAHFSKFVRPGAVRVATSGGVKGVRVMTFEQSDGGYVVELLNSLREVAKVNVEFAGKVVGVDLAGRSITTLTW